MSGTTKPKARLAARFSTVTGAQLRRFVEASDGSVLYMAYLLGVSESHAYRLVSGDLDGRLPVSVDLLMRLAEYEPDILRTNPNGTLRQWRPSVNRVSHRRKKATEAANVE
jgi:hypothetical protein